MDFEAPPMAGWKSALAWIPIGLGTLGLLFGAGVVLAPAHVDYSITPDTLVVHASMGPLQLGRETPRSEVHGGRRQALHHGRRTAGTARGDFCQGRWWFDETGPAWVAGTCVADTVVLDVGDEHWVLTPAEPDGFLAAVDHGSGEFAAAPNSDRKAAGALVLIALVSLPLLAVFPLLGRRITQPLVYSIRAGTLHVPGNLWTVKMALRGATFRGRRRGTDPPGQAPRSAPRDASRGPPCGPRPFG